MKRSRVAKVHRVEPIFRQSSPTRKPRNIRLLAKVAKVANNILSYKKCIPPGYRGMCLYYKPLGGMAFLATLARTALDRSLQREKVDYGIGYWKKKIGYSLDFRLFSTDNSVTGVVPGYRSYVWWLSPG